jgi:hypothetical protein
MTTRSLFAGIPRYYYNYTYGFFLRFFTVTRLKSCSIHVLQRLCLKCLLRGEYFAGATNKPPWSLVVNRLCFCWILLISTSVTLPPSPAQTVIVIYKQELRLEIWKDGNRTQQFSICSLSSLAGRKTAQGDQQVPEGIYAITGFNPKSASYKTLNLNYPNAFDRSQGATGGGIGIHGKCASVGCIGMRNDQMDSIEKALKHELTRLPIPVLIFYSEKAERVERLIQLFRKQGNETEMKFVKQLERVREFWDEHHRVPEYTWDKHGYLLKQ